MVLVGTTIYYARQNSRMVVEIQRQNRPYVYLTHDGKALVLENSGTRSAHDVSIAVTHDTMVPRQLRLVSTVEIRRGGEPVPPRPPDATPEQIRAVMQGREAFSTLATVRAITPTITPGGRKMVAQAELYLGARETQRLGCLVKYRDSTGNRYEEPSDVEYEINE